MGVLSISYDLYKEPGRAYDELIAAIKGLGSWCKAVESTWYVDTSSSPSEALARLKPHLHAKDKIIITPVTAQAGWATQGLSEPVLKWIKERLSAKKKV